MESVFEQSGQPTDATYIFLGDSADAEMEPYRALLQPYWNRFSAYADRNFRQELGVDFDSRFWEMYLACTLLDQGLTLACPSRNGGPDIRIETLKGSIFVEAVRPRKERQATLTEFHG